MDDSTIEAAKDRLRIPLVWRLCGFEGKPSLCCRSPFREDRNPSFSVYDDGLRWKDFASGEAGDAIDFLGKARGIENREAVREFLALADARHSIGCDASVSYRPKQNDEPRPELSRFRPVQ